MPAGRIVPNLYHFLATAIEIVGGSKGMLQLYDERGRSLSVVAHIGFNDDFLGLFSKVTDESDFACAMAMRQRGRVIIEDTREHPKLKALNTLGRFGYAGVLSLPICDERGRLFGIVSVHSTGPMRPQASSLVELDDYVDQAMSVLSRQLEAFRRRADTDPA